MKLRKKAGDTLIEELAETFTKGRRREARLSRLGDGAHQLRIEYVGVKVVALVQKLRGGLRHAERVILLAHVLVLRTAVITKFSFPKI